MPLIIGYPIVWNSLPVDHRPEWDFAARGAFADSIASGRAIDVTIGHYAELSLHGQLLLHEDDVGVLVKAELLPSRLSILLEDSLRLGRFTQMSFTSRARRTRYLWTGKRQLRELLKGDLAEICFTESPAHPQTCARLARVPDRAIDRSAPSVLSKLIEQCRLSRSETSRDVA